MSGKLQECYRSFEGGGGGNQVNPPPLTSKGDKLQLGKNCKVNHKSELFKIINSIELLDLKPKFQFEMRWLLNEVQFKSEDLGEKRNISYCVRASLVSYRDLNNTR